MNKFQTQVTEFHKAMGQDNSVYFNQGRELRAKLILEEAVETVAALGYYARAELWDAGYDNMIAEYGKAYHRFNLIDYIDGLCDLTYVTMGGAVDADINLERHFDEVHRCNMKKLDGPKREDGKQLKPEGWQGPDHGSIIEVYLPVSEAQERETNDYERTYWPDPDGPRKTPGNER